MIGVAIVCEILFGRGCICAVVCSASLACRQREGTGRKKESWKEEENATTENMT